MSYKDRILASSSRFHESLKEMAAIVDGIQDPLLKEQLGGRIKILCLEYADSMRTAIDYD